MADGHADVPTGDAEYVFTARIRLSPDDPDVQLEPAVIETALLKRAPPPGEDGWLFFRDNLWRGEINDETHARSLAEKWLGAEIDEISFRELRTDQVYLDALKAEIETNLALFRADNVADVLKKYLGSSIHVRKR